MKVQRGDAPSILMHGMQYTSGPILPHIQQSSHSSLSGSGAGRPAYSSGPCIMSLAQYAVGQDRQGSASSRCWCRMTSSE